MDFIKRHFTHILYIFSILFIGVPEYIETIWSLEEKFEEQGITMPDISWAFGITAPIGLAMVTTVYLLTRRKQFDLKIEVHRHGLAQNWMPSPFRGSMLTHMIEPKSIVSVTTKFIPKGNPIMKSLFLYVGNNPYEPVNLPISVLDREEVYEIDFMVPNSIITKAMNRDADKNYIRVVSSERDYRSNNFKIYIGEKVN